MSRSAFRAQHPFVDATHFLRVAPGRYEGAFTEDWFQGKGAYGGVVAGCLARCLEDTVADPRRRLRSLAVHFAAPAAAGHALVETRLERMGSLVSHLSARLSQRGQAAAVATATFAGARAGISAPLRFSDAVMPAAPRPDAVEPIADNPLMPTFTQFFEYRFCVGNYPYSGADEAVLGGWIRPKEPLPVDATLAMALLDAFPPAVLARSDRPRAAVSVDMTAHFFAELPLPADEPLLLVARSRWSDEGYADEHAELWTAGGERVAACEQLVAVLG